jgi:hypothetical protein
MDLSDVEWFREVVRADHIAWLNIPGARLRVNTNDFKAVDLNAIVRSIQSHL